MVISTSAFPPVPAAVVASLSDCCAAATAVTTACGCVADASLNLAALPSKVEPAALTSSLALP